MKKIKKTHCAHWMGIMGEVNLNAFSVFAFLILGISGNCFTQSTNKNENMNANNQAKSNNANDFKSAYFVKMEGHNIGYALYINDIPVWNDEFGGIKSKLLINPYIINGTNTYKFISLPVDEATGKNKEWIASEKTCTLIIIEAQGEGSADKEVAQVELKPFEGNKICSKEGTFNATLSYSNPPWATSAKIGRDKVTQQKILDKYKEFHHLLEKKDIDGIMKVSSYKFKEYAKSMYNPNFEAEKKESFMEQLKSPDELIGIEVQEKNGLRYEYYHGDRLVTIKNDDDRSIIMYYGNGVTTSYTLYYYFDGKDFVLIL